MRNPQWFGVAVGLALACAAGKAHAADLELSSGDDIAAAVGASSDGDTITLGEGTYAVHGLTVNKGISLVAKRGCEVTINLQSQPDGIVLDHAAACLEGCRVTNCRSSAVVVKSGARLVDCVFTGLNEKSGTGVENFSLQNGTIRGCTFRNFTGGYAYKNYIVKVTGGLFADSVVEGAGSEFDWMVYVDGASAVVTNLVVRNSPGKGTAGGDNLENGVLCLMKGLVTHSVITNSGSVGASKSGTVKVAGGTLRNSLVADCKGLTYPGVYMTSGRLENCTIANNTTKAATVNGYSLRMTGGTAVNNVFSDNAVSANSVVVTGGTFENNLVPVDIGRGTGNRVGVPFFVDPANGDYAPGLMSPAVDSAQNLDWIDFATLDLAGEARVKGEGLDMGAFEGPYGPDDPLACGFTLENNQFRADAANRVVTFFAHVVGQGAEGASYAWYLNDEDSPFGTGASLATDALPVGLHSVSLVVTPSGAGAAPIVYEMSNCVLIYPKTMYVDASNNSPQFPYDSPAKAATSIRDVLDFLEVQGGVLPGYAAGESAAVTVEVADGTYRLQDLILKSPVRLVAKSGASPVLDLAKVDPGLMFSDGRQVLDGFTVINGRTRALRFYAGSCMRNCRVDGLENVISGTASHFILVSDATVSNCVFTGAHSTQHTYGDPVLELVGSSYVSDCLFEDITKLDSIVYVAGEQAVMTRCEFRNCPLESQSGTNPSYNVMYLTAGLVSHCVITNCGSASVTWKGRNPVGGIVGVNGDSATLRNCLIADCSAKENAGIDLAKGVIENCTVLGGTLSPAASGSQRNLKQAGGRVVNSIFWNDSGIDGVTLSGGTFEYSSSVDLKLGTSNKSGDPLLDDAFVPANASFARDNGTSLAWITEDAVDLRGSNRVVNAAVDMGAFEGDELKAELVLLVEASFSRLDGDEVVYSFAPDARIGYDPVVDPEFVWTVDGEPAGTSSGAKEFALLPRSEPYAVVCAIAAGGQSATAPLSVPVHNGVFFVSPEGTSEAPYDTWEKAARALDTILAMPHPAADTRTYTVHLSAGNHSTCGFRLTSAMALVGEDGAVFNAGEMPVLSYPGCSVSNLVFSNVGFTMNNGSARNIVVRNRTGQSAGTLVTISGGTCEGLVMTNCRTTAWNYQYGISVSGSARLSDFRIENCAGYDAMLTVKDLAVVSNGTIKASNGVLGSGQGNTHEYLISAEGGLVSHVSVTDCGDERTTGAWSSRDGAVRVAGGAVRNCLIAGNRSTDCAGVNLVSGNLESCTVVVNDGDVLHKTGYGTYGSCLNMTGGFATNCVFYSTEAAANGWNYCRVTGGKIGNCWLSVKGGDVTPAGEKILVGADPLFKSVDGWNYVPAGGSPLIGAGINQFWMTDATDLAGQDRIAGRKVDLGAFEGVARGLRLIVR